MKYIESQLEQAFISLLETERKYYSKKNVRYFSRL